MAAIPSSSPRSRTLARGRRIVLRTPTAADEEEFLALRRASWTFLAPWQAESPGLDPLGSAMFERYLRFGAAHARLRLLVCSRRSGAILGSISLSDIDRVRGTATVGYWIGERHARKGKMSEALALVLERVASRLDLRALEVYVLPENRASKGLLAKLGFTRRGTAFDYQVVRGEARDHERWTFTCPSRASSGNPG
ncbi:MAG: GNAT family N-acetyltransferase [Planctomycetes bacterium]|nr:GNAT family N-acetyltransferase [Planctomycetota bacterium]